MTPTALSALMIRFVALGLMIYGVILLIRGLIAQSEVDQMQDTFQALASLSDTSSNTGGQSGDSSIDSFGGPMNKMVQILFISSGITVLVSAVLYGASHRLGALIARGLQ